MKDIYSPLDLAVVLLSATPTGGSGGTEKDPEHDVTESTGI